ncbi:MAG: branched-chain amino acid ABC transporter permease [Ilumatobacteraceae bacterium]
MTLTARSADAAGAARQDAPPAPFRPSVGGWLARGVLWLAVAYLVLVLPLSRPGIDLREFAIAACYAIVALSLNVLLGYIGQISLGHAAFVGIGAFTSAYLVTEQGQSFWVGVLAASAIGGFQALILGGVSLRVKGLYFALITLSYGLVAEQNIFQIQDFTGGGAGQRAPKPDWFDTEWRYYYLCLAFLALVLYVDWRMMRTKAGRALLALRENPRVASTFGINVPMATLLAFVVSGAFAGLAGALIAHGDESVSPDVWNFQLSLVFVIMTVVGGLRSRAGLVIGGAFFALLPYIIQKIPGFEDLLTKIPGPVDLSPELATLIIGPLLLLINLIRFPGGIGQQIRPIQRWMSGHRFDLHDRGPKEVQITDVRA